MWFKNKMSACFKNRKDEGRLFWKTNKKTFHRIIFHNFDQQPEGKAMFKSKFCHEFKEMKENNFTIVHFMTADATHVAPAM